jgi:hypothetical protein
MSAVPLLRPREVVRALATLSVPDHAQVARGTLRTLIAKAGLTVEDFLAAVR